MCVLCTLKCEGRVGAKKTGRRIMVRKLISVEHVAGDRRGRESERGRERERERGYVGHDLMPCSSRPIVT